MRADRPAEVDVGIVAFSRTGRDRGLKPLEEAQAAEKVQVASVFERDRGLLEYLDGAGIRPGVRLEVLAADGEMELRAEGRPIRIERPVAAKVWVRPYSDFE